MSNKVLEDNMSYSASAEAQPSTGNRTAVTAVKYPSIAPLVYISNSSTQNNGNTVKGFSSIPVSSSQRPAPVRVSTVANSSSSNGTLLQQNANRSLLSKPPNPLMSNNKSNQTIVVANSSGVIRSVPGAMVMGSGTHKKQIITFGNTIGNVGNQVSLLDPKNLKYIGTFLKNKKSLETSTETATQPNEDQNVLLVSSSNSLPVNQSPTYILPKTQKGVSQNVVYTQVPGSQGKRLQVLLTTDGTLPTKGSTSLVQSGASVSSKQESIIVNKVSGPIISMNATAGSSKTVEVITKDKDSSTTETISKVDNQSLEQIVQKSKSGKYIIPRGSGNSTSNSSGYKSSSNQVLVPVKWKKQEGTGKLQATSLGQIVSSGSPGVTSFQISNGQILTDKVPKPHMLSLLYENYGVEVVKSSSMDKTKEEQGSEEVSKIDDKEGEPEEGSKPEIVSVTEKPKIEPPPVKPEGGTVRHRRKQELEIKQDTLHTPPIDDGLEVKIKTEVECETDVSNGETNFVSKDENLNENKIKEESDDAENEKGGKEAKENVGSENSEDPEKENKKVDHGGDMDKFDPIKCLEWSDNIGSLPLSDLKFRLNEFGLIEIVEEDDEEGKVSSKSSVVSDAEKTEGKHKQKTRNSDEILCCHSCGTYGMGCEFVSSRFCSVACSKAYAEEKAQSVKKLLLKQEKKMKLKQQKALLMQQRAKLEKLGLHEAKVAIEEKIRMLRMERELMKTNAGDSDAESGSGASSSTDKLRSSSKGFSWTRYLTMLKAKSAPYTLFKDPFPTSKNNFKVGMKLEGIDPVHPSLFCVLTVAAVRGYRIKLHFDGYPDCHDFWVNVNSSDIFHAGWCERTNHKLSAPKGYGERNFNWGNYLRMTRTVAAPKSCFVNNQEKPIIPSGFRAGMKLEAVDKKNSSLVCVATIADVLDNRILVHFDSWDDIYDYWVDCTSPYIHPVGWCKENGHQLTPPNDYKDPSLFSWDIYLRETKSLPAPARAFKPRTTTDFRRGMKLECVDKRNPILIRVATVVDIVVQQIKIKFDGWPDQFAYWLDDDSPDIHPAGWCHKTGHPLEPPPSEEDIKNTMVCPTPGCRGIGHVKGKHPVHHMVLSCPYSSMNYLRDDHIPDRFCSKREYYEVKETSASKGTKPRPGIPRKYQSVKCEVPALPVSKTDIQNRGRKRKIEPPILVKKKFRGSSSSSNTGNTGSSIGNSSVASVLEENVDPSSRNEPTLWTKNRWDISETVASIGPDPLSWTPDQVASFVENINSSSEKGKLFVEHQIDGEALLMLSQNDLVQILGFKLGPAIKLYKSIVLLRQKALESKNGVSS